VSTRRLTNLPHTLQFFYFQLLCPVTYDLFIKVMSGETGVP